MTEKAKISKDGKLIAYDDWCRHVDSLKTGRNITDEKTAVIHLKDKIENAVRTRIPEERFGILFSGGVDSSLIAFICKKHTDNFICYTVGIEGSKDLEASGYAAKKLGLLHKEKKLTIEEMETLFEKTAKLLGGLTDIVNLGVGSVEIAALEMAKKDRITKIFTGLGSEEIFAGYQRHEKANDINAECWNGLKGMWNRDFKRDFIIAKHMGVFTLTPFLDGDLIKAAMEIDGSLKIKEHKKYILRKTAIKLGLPDEISMRPKVAAQYGSSFDKAIMRIAKSKGYKLKGEYLSYLKSLQKE